jgi:hypothetical protein
VILDRRLPDGQRLRSQPRLQAMRAEGAQSHRERGEQGAEGEEDLQAGFFVFLFGRPGRFLP